MVRSHVYSCFWLVSCFSVHYGLPSRFCKKILPKWDSTLILEHESGSTQETTYLAKRTGLSGGWRAFAIEYKLNDGDALVFQLVEPERFKVCIAFSFQFVARISRIGLHFQNIISFRW
ncbi:unnamed protein product [Linum tenue]|uniref:TF-B3 domain-containing protein n=1 Tax=Linum tenue TaxID=586396 RepID=A0AAV0K408_9ROSI|nr:unnamed protein product [Linum tenue]CAI0416115.1 unnamed protein product [Linum tenue]